jgi:hypothetical protein
METANMQSRFARRCSQSSDSTFEFIASDPAGSSNEIVSSWRAETASPETERLATSFAELSTMVYPPDPDYNVAEKPWLPGAQKPYLIVNAKLVDPRAGVVHHDMTLQLAGGKVVRVAPTTQQELTAEFYCAGQRVERIDASRYFVCPGLIDCQ